MGGIERVCAGTATLALKCEVYINIYTRMPLLDRIDFPRFTRRVVPSPKRVAPRDMQFYWLNVNAGYDGDVFMTIVLNGFIHTVMYTYYFVSMHTKDIWWKKYLTLMQVSSILESRIRCITASAHPFIHYVRHAVDYYQTVIACACCSESVLGPQR